jgi:hypothetical protein
MKDARSSKVSRANEETLAAASRLDIVCMVFLALAMIGANFRPLLSQRARLLRRLLQRAPASGEENTILRSSEQAGEPPNALSDLLGRHRAERQPHEPVARYGTAIVGVGEERRPRGEYQAALLRAAY